MTQGASFPAKPALHIPDRPVQDEEEGLISLCFALRAAGYHLYSAYDYTILAMEKGLVKTDIQISLLPGSYGRVAPHSGLIAKHFIGVGAGVIDEDYRGNVGVVLFNFGKETFEVKRGDQIAQLICEQVFFIQNLKKSKA
uniref:Deoxyuridine 5'-triphosphate nucleotidohydrolase n=1 Tax=Vombatus ursinus TaxID=29139 RepID=A0A4X2JVZ2_VOMUR